MKATEDAEFVLVERQRMRLEYQRRAREIASDLYAPWQPSARFMLESRNRTAAWLLHRAGAFPKAGDQCLEVGFGTLGWLGELINWGVRETDVHGIELDPTRAEKAQESLSLADLRIGDAVDLPWDDDSLQLVITSTFFSSILDMEVRRLIADQIVRVLAPGGSLLWYDFAYNNPKNPNVRGISRAEIERLFPQLRGTIKSATLAPPIARWIAPRSWALASLLEAIPPLRTHLVAVLVKSGP